MSEGMLTDMACRKSKCPADKAKIKLTDGGGIHLVITAAGGRYWYIVYRINSQRREMSLGAYPRVSLLAARNKRDTARQLVRQGIDPRDAPESLAASALGSMPTFAVMFNDFLQHKGRSLSPRTLRETESRIRCHALPVIGDVPLDQITPPLLLAMLRQIEKARRYHTAHRVRSIVSRVMQYAVSCSLIDHDPAASLAGALAPENAQHRAAILHADQLAMLMRAIDGYEGHAAVCCALRLLPRLFVRPGELRLAEWREVDLDGAVWSIPSARLKIRQQGDHIVPLARQVVEILREMHQFSEHRQLIMPGIRSGRPLSDNTYNAALRALGYDGQTQTAHGFRATARSLLSEHGWPTEAIERQLAHAGKDMVARAYARAEYLDLRREMMQRWADYLDALQNGDVAAAGEALKFHWQAGVASASSE